MRLSIIVATLEGCPADLLDDPQHIQRLMEEAVRVGGFTMLNTGTTSISVVGQDAFINGRIRLFGDQQALMGAQPVFAALDHVFSTVRERTSYE